MSAETPLPFTEFVFKGTSRCNLQPSYDGTGKFVGGCDYVPGDEATATGAHGCYEYANDMWRDQPAWMSPEVTKQAARRVGEHALKHSLSDVRIIGHGGELLMASAEWLDKFSATITQEIRAVSPNTKPHFFVTTNGTTLTPDRLAILEKHNYRVGLSLDGDKVANDRHRRDRRGESVYDRTVEAAKMLGESKLNWGILAVIDSRNDPKTVLDSLASHNPESIMLLLPHANNSVAPDANPVEYGRWLNQAFDWYVGQEQDGFIFMPDFHSLMTALLGGTSLREAVADRPSQELFFLPNGFYQRVDTIKSTEPGAVATGMDIYHHSIDDVAERDPGVIARRLGKKALAEECLSCPLLDACGGGYYPHRFQSDSSGRKLRIGDPVWRFVDAFRHPTKYCDAQKVHIPHVAALVERSLGAPPGTLLKPKQPVPEQSPLHPAPPGYEISIPVEGDELDITAVHADVYRNTYLGVGRGATEENLEAFVHDTTPGVGFWDRKLTEWGSLVADKQPDPEARHILLVARDQATGEVIGFASGRILHRDRLSYDSPMNSSTDTITGVFVLPSHQRQGVGAALAAAILHQMGPSATAATTYGTPAVKFFESLGFEQRPNWVSGAAPHALAYGIWLRQVAMYLARNPHYVSRSPEMFRHDSTYRAKSYAAWRASRGLQSSL